MKNVDAYNVSPSSPGTKQKSISNKKPKRKQQQHKEKVEDEWVENVKVDLSEGIRRSQRQRSAPSRYVVYERIDDEVVTAKGEEGEDYNVIDFVDTLHVSLHYQLLIV